MSKRLSVSRHAAPSAGPSKRPGSIAPLPWPLVLALISALLGSALPGLAAGRESRPRSVLTHAPGLEKRVTYSETKIPLGEIIARVAADTGVPLTAARDVADEPVAVVVTDFPARELLEQLADLLDYHWSRRGQRPTLNAAAAQRLKARTPERPIRYEIWQDLASKQREEALRQALYAGGVQRLQEQLALCRELGGKSQEEMRRLWDEATRWNERLEKLTLEERQGLQNSPEFRQREVRYDLVRQLWSPVKRSLALFMNRLSPEQLAALRSGQQVIYSSDPQPGELSLPPDVLRVFRTSRPSVSPPGQPISAQPEREERMRWREREEQEGWDQAEHYEVIFRLFAFETCWWNPGSIQFEARAAPVRGAKRLGKRSDWLNYFSLYVRGPAEAVPLPEEDPGRRTRLEQDPVLSVRKAFQQDARPYVDPLFPGAPRTVWLLPERLPEVARAYGVHIIADSYWSASSVAGPSSIAGTRPLFEVLDGLADSSNWDRRGDLIRFRNRRWFLHRPREIPLRTVRRWAALQDRLGALPLEGFVHAATTLTDLQLETLERLFQRGVFPPHLVDLRGLEVLRNMLRLYGRLSPAQRQALQAGKPLATAQLSQVLRPFVLAQLNRANRWSESLPDLEQWSSGHLFLTRTPDVRLREQRGKSVTFRLESEPAPHPATRLDAITRFPVTRWGWEIHYGAKAPAAAELIVAADFVPSE
jgi:hypothetical protein